MSDALQGTKDVYQMQRKLGEGGFGETFLATAQSDDRVVVVKRLRVDRLDDWKALELFEREAKVLETLDHPNIPRYVDAFEDPDGTGLVLVQEYIEGKTLRAFLQDGTELDEARMTSWFLDILEVCAYLHALDPPVIHRDVNPNNIILRDTDSVPFLIDFGTVQAAIKSESTISSTAAGTFGYAPTEQFIGKAYPSSDLYGLGMTFLALWTGLEPEDMPFSVGEIQLDELLRERPMDGRLKLALERMIDRVPENRPASAGEVLTRLTPLRQRSSGSAATAAPAKPTRDTSGEHSASNKWREAKARLERLDAETLLGDLSREFDEVRYLGNWALSADAKQMLITRDKRGALLLDADTMAVAKTLGGIADDDALGFAPDGSFVIAFNGWDEHVTRFQLPDGKSRRQEPPPELRSSDYGGNRAPIAISPDGKIGALGSPLALFDTTTGALIRLTDIESEARPCFSPDGTTLVGQSRSMVVVMAMEGGRYEMRGTCLAFTPDGRTIAVAQGSEKFEIHLNTWDPSRKFASAAPDRRFTIPLPSEGRIAHLCFDPTGRWLAIGASVKHRPPAAKDWTWGSRVLVLDTQEGDIVADFGDPSRGGNALDGLYGFGFDDASKRLFVHASCYPTVYDRDDEYVVLVHDLHRNQLLAILDAQGMRTPEGFFSPFPTAKDPESPETGPYAGMALRAACGDSLEGELDEAARDALDDLRERVKFIQELFMRADEPFGLALPYESDLRPLLDATKGLTHMLPWIVDDARKRAAAVPAFGAAKGEKPPVRVHHLLEAANELAARGESERDALFEEMLEQLETAAKRREAPKPAPPKRQAAAPAPTLTPANYADDEGLVRHEPSPHAGKLFAVVLVAILTGLVVVVATVL